MKKIISILFIFVLFTACKKDEAAPVNPYDLVDYGLDDGSLDTLDPNGIVAIHKEILLPKCSTPGCHDGTFEPDFRTVMSSYTTLVYHPIIKNDPDSQFFFRVIPYDTTNSVLQKRLNWQTFANTNDRMPQDNIGTGLPQEDLDRISAWILNGAKDPEEYVSHMPNLQPYANWVWMIEGAPNIFDIWSNPINTLSGLDNRDGDKWNDPMIVDDLIQARFRELKKELDEETNIRVENMLEVINDQTLEKIVDDEMWIFMIPDIVDDSTEIKDLQNLKVELSYDMDFGSIEFSDDGVYLPPNGDDGNQWYFNFQLPSSLQNNTQIFIRVKMNDGDHVEDSSYPRDFASEWDKNVASLIIIPGSHQ